MAWQEHHIARLKLYHQTLWKLSKTINYQGISGGLAYVKHDKVGYLIKKLIIHPFSEFQSFQMNMAQFSPNCLPLSLLSPSHSYTQTDTHFSFSGYSCATSVDPEWVCVNFCIHYHNYTFKSRLVFFFRSDSLFFFFSQSGEIEKLISVLLWCGRGSTRESCSVLSVRTCGRGTPRWQVSRCSFLLYTFTCPHSRLRRPSPHLLWSKTASA